MVGCCGTSEMILNRFNQKRRTEIDKIKNNEILKTHPHQETFAHKPPPEFIKNGKVKKFTRPPPIVNTHYPPKHPLYFKQEQPKENEENEINEEINNN